MKVAVAVLFLSSFSSAQAGPRTLAIASGDCREPELLDAMTRFSDAIGARLGADAAAPAAVLERFHPRPTVGLDEVQRQFETAQTQFYSSQYDLALENARGALQGLERLPPAAKAWKLTASAHLLEGLVLKAQKKKAESTEAFRRVLRVEPAYALDPDYYTPATITQFEQVRAETLKLKRVELQLNSTPTGADVVLDGCVVGTTPFKGSYLPGTYRLLLARGGSTSFVYDLKLDKSAELQIDLAFEGALRPTLPLCVSATSAEPDEKALKLAARMGVDRVVVFHLDSRSGEPGFARAVLIEVNQGTRVREGGLRLSQARVGAGLVELAAFVLTGASSGGVVALGAGAPANAPVPAVVEPSASPASTVAAVSPVSGARIASFVLMGAGAATVVGGLGVYLAGGTDRTRLASLLDSNGTLPAKGTPDYDLAVALIPRVQGNQQAAVVLASVGAAVAVGGVVLYLLSASAPSAAPQVFVGPTGSGAMAGVSGRF